MLSVAQAPDIGLQGAGTLQRTIQELLKLSSALANTDTFNITTQGDVQQTMMTKESLLVQGLERAQEHKIPGVYDHVEETLVNDKHVWCKRGASAKQGRFLYCVGPKNDGTEKWDEWHIGGKEDMENGRNSQMLRFRVMYGEVTLSTAHRFEVLHGKGWSMHGKEWATSPDVSVTTKSLSCTGCGESVARHNFGEHEMSKTHCLCNCCSVVAVEMQKQFPGLNRKEDRRVSLSVLVDLSSLHNAITKRGRGPAQSMSTILKRVGICGVNTSREDDDGELSEHRTWYKLCIDPRTIALSDIGKTTLTKLLEESGEEVETANKSLTEKKRVIGLVDKAEEALVLAGKSQEKANATKVEKKLTHKQSLGERRLCVRTFEISFFRDALERIECVLKLEDECRRKVKEEKILRQWQGEFLANELSVFENAVHRTFSIFFNTDDDLLCASQAPRLLLDAAEASASIKLQPCGSADDHSQALCSSATMKKQWEIASQKQAKDHVSKNAKGFDSCQSFLEAQFVNAKHIAQCIANLTRSHMMTKEMLMQDQFAPLLRALVLRAFQYPDREMQRALCVTFRHLMGHHDNNTMRVRERNQQSRRKESGAKPKMSTASIISLTPNTITGDKNQREHAKVVEMAKEVLKQQRTIVRVLKACGATQSLVHTCRTCSHIKVHTPVRVATAGMPLFYALSSGHGKVYEGENTESKYSTHCLDIQELEEKRASSLLHKNADAALNIHSALSYKRFYVVEKLKLNVGAVGDVATRGSGAEKKERDDIKSPVCNIDGVILEDGDRVLIKNEVGTTMLHGIWEFHKEPRTRSNFQDIAIAKSEDSFTYQRVWRFTRKDALDLRSFVMVKDGKQNKGLGFLINSGLDAIKESFTPENTSNITVHLSGAFIEPWKLDPLSHSTYSVNHLLMYITSGDWAGWCGTVLRHRTKSRHEGHSTYSVALLHSTASATLTKEPPIKRVVQVDGHALVMVHLDETELAIETLFRFWDFVGATERSLQRSKTKWTNAQQPPTDHVDASDEQLALKLPHISPQTWKVLPVEGTFGPGSSSQRSKTKWTNVQQPPTDHIDASDEQPALKLPHISPQTWKVLPVEGAGVIAPRPWIIKSIHFKEYMLPRFRWCKQDYGQDLCDDYTVEEGAKIEASFQVSEGTHETNVVCVGDGKVYLANAAEQNGQKVYRAEVTSKSGLKIHCNVVRQERFKITVKFLHGQADKEEADVVMDAHIARIFSPGVVIRAAVEDSSVDEANAKQVTELQRFKVKSVTEEPDLDRIRYELHREGEAGPTIVRFHNPYREEEGGIHTPFSELDHFNVGDAVKLRMQDNVIRDG
jgi:hypothetical protein